MTRPTISRLIRFLAVGIGWLGIAAVPLVVASPDELDLLLKGATDHSADAELQQSLRAVCLDLHLEPRAVVPAMAASATASNWRSTMLVATALARLGRYAEALAVANEQAQPTPPHDLKQLLDAAAMALMAEEQLHRAIPTGNRVALAEACQQLEHALRLDPANPAIRKTLSWVYLDQLHQPREAYPHLAQLARDSPTDPDIKRLLALASSQTGRLRRAVAAFREILAAEPDDLWMRFNMARTLARLDRRREAEYLYHSILEQETDHFHARLGQAELAAWGGRREEAEAMLRQLLQEKPNDPEAEALLADLHRWDWNVSQAKAAYERVLAQEPNFVDAQIGQRALLDAAAWRFCTDAYHFADNTDFARSSLAGSLRAPLGDHVYLRGEVALWRFSHPAFEDLIRWDGTLGLEYHPARWLEVVGHLGILNYQNRSAFLTGQVLSKLSPIPGRELYFALSLNQPFVSSISTVYSGLREDSVGAGTDWRLGGGFSVQTSVILAQISDGNAWVRVKPQVSYRLLRSPSFHARVEYDYLTYAEPRFSYWTPADRSVLSPLLDLAFPLNRTVIIESTLRVPYVFDESEFGVQVLSGVQLRLWRQLQVHGWYLYSSVPENRAPWSGSGWRAALTWFF